MDDKMEITPISREHFETIADIHMESLAGDFLPSMGRRFLITLYEAMFAAEAAFGYVGLVDREIAGFFIFTPDSSRLFSLTLKQRFLKLSWLAALRVLQNPIIVTRILETFLYESRATLPGIVAEMMLWSIRPEFRRKGYGSQLWDVFRREVLRRDLSTYKVTVYADNEAANSFYRGKGLTLEREFELYGRKWNLYVGTITDTPSSPDSDQTMQT
jgi:ribosomal protein S18 acetylase RimI-like enzyme